jgi:hypothetical protein
LDVGDRLSVAVLEKNYSGKNKMNRKIIYILAILCSTAATQPVHADVCDYRPSKLLGNKVTATAGGATGATAATGTGMKTAGFYAITHSTSGAAMLGSTAAGSSAAGTVGIIKGSAGLIGTLGGALLSPFVIIPAAVAAVSIGAFEGTCYYIASGEAESSKDARIK